MNLASPFSLSIVAITVLAFLGLPIGLSMIAGSIFYLMLSGADMGIAAEQFLNGMYSNYVILAVPLFVLLGQLDIGRRDVRGEQAHLAAEDREVDHRRRDDGERRAPAPDGRAQRESP